MLRFITSRFLQSLLALFLVISATFFMVRFVLRTGKRKAASGLSSRELLFRDICPDASTKIIDLAQATVGSLFTSVGKPLLSQRPFLMLHKPYQIE